MHFKKPVAIMAATMLVAAPLAFGSCSRKPGPDKLAERGMICLDKNGIVACSPAVSRLVDEARSLRGTTLNFATRKEVPIAPNVSKEAYHMWMFADGKLEDVQGYGVTLDKNGCARLFGVDIKVTRISSEPGMAEATFSDGKTAGSCKVVLD